MVVRLIEPVAGDARPLRRVLARFPTGVTAVAARVAGTPVGLAISSFTSVSLAPPIVSICVGDGSRSWPLLRRSARLGISVLADDQGDLCRRLAGPESHRFTDAGWRNDPGGAMFAPGAIAWFDCAIRDEIPAGDHILVLCDVLRTAADPAAAPLIFHGSTFHRLRTADDESRAY